MRIITLIGMIIGALVLSSIPIYAGCHSDCQATYEACTGYANSQNESCDSACYDLYGQCMNGVDYEYTICMTINNCYWYIVLNIDPAYWDQQCYGCYANREYIGPMICMNARWNCISTCNSNLDNAIEACDNSKVSCDTACCFDSVCEEGETCSSCPASCGPC
jgi:hypothetical protein